MVFQATERLYLTRNGKRIVKEGDPEAASLFVAAGGYVPFQLAERYGLTEKALETPAPTARDEAPQVIARLEPPTTTHRRGPREHKDGT